MDVATAEVPGISSGAASVEEAGRTVLPVVIADRSTNLAGLEIGIVARAHLETGVMIAVAAVATARIAETVRKAAAAEMIVVAATVSGLALSKHPLP